MHYENMTPGIFLARPNRFIAHVQIDGQTEVVHVKNTGRCRELLVPGCTVLHTTDKFHIFRIRVPLGSFIMNKSCRIIILDPACHSLVIRALSRLVT